MRSQRLALLFITLLVAGCNGNKDDSSSTDDSAVDEDGDGYASSEDCDDSDPAIHPGVTGTCDAVDEDCDGAVDEGLAAVYYADGDEDGYGNPDASTEACSQPEGYADNSEDCDDTNAAANPGATETCNELDDDCDSQTDEGVTTSLFADADGDGFGDPDAVVEACEGVSGAVADSSDCDDADAWAFPGAAETCDGVDNDCDGVVEGGGLVSWNDATDGSGTWSDVSTEFSGSSSEPARWVSEGSGQLCFADATHYVSIEAQHDLEVHGYASGGSVLSGASSAQVVHTTAEGVSLSLQSLEIAEGLADTADDCGYSTRSVDRAAGAGVCCGGSGTSLTIVDSVLRDSEAYMGAGLFSSLCDVRLEGSTVSGNVADFGGGVTIRGGVAELSDCLIEENYAGVRAGGLYVAGSDYGQPVVSLIDVLVFDNEAVDSGGGIYIGTRSDPAEVTCAVTQTSASQVLRNTAAEGGGVFISASSFSSTGCDFGTGADDNSGDDVWVDDISTAYTYGDNETFACDSSGCQ